jgi:mRNA interferase RelE/StbE
VRLQGVEREYRLRVGDWRVRFTLDEAIRVMTVLRVLPRGGAYR